MAHNILLSLFCISNLYFVGFISSWFYLLIVHPIITFTLEVSFEKNVLLISVTALYFWFILLEKEISFIVLQENWLLLAADYSQIELRLMAHFSGDTSLIELLSNPQNDVFTMIAARWTGRVEDSVSSLERDQTKRLVYGILYGMGANTLAEQLNCSSDAAKEKIKSFKSSFPGVASWLHEAVSGCRQKG